MHFYLKIYISRNTHMPCNDHNAKHTHKQMMTNTINSQLYGLVKGSLHGVEDIKMENHNHIGSSSPIYVLSYITKETLVLLYATLNPEQLFCWPPGSILPNSIISCSSTSCCTDYLWHHSHAVSIVHTSNFHNFVTNTNKYY